MRAVIWLAGMRSQFWRDPASFMLGHLFCLCFCPLSPTPSSTATPPPPPQPMSLWKVLHYRAQLTSLALPARLLLSPLYCTKILQSKWIENGPVPWYWASGLTLLSLWVFFIFKIFMVGITVAIHTMVMKKNMWKLFEWWDVYRIRWHSYVKWDLL